MKSRVVLLEPEGQRTKNISPLVHSRYNHDQVPLQCVTAPSVTAPGVTAPSVTAPRVTEMT